jgi:hypothetical protein
MSLPPGFVLDGAPAGPVYGPPPSRRTVNKDALEVQREDRIAGTDARNASNEAARLRISNVDLQASLLKSGMRVGPNGQVEKIPGWVAPDDSKPTEFQAKSAAFYKRMLDARDIYDAVPADSRDARATMGQWLREWAPSVENALPTFLGGNSPDRQIADAAMGNFSKAGLRQESGAVIGPEEEAAQNRTFFPYPGDAPATLNAKREMRNSQTEGMRMTAGPLASRVEQEYWEGGGGVRKAQNPALQPDGATNALKVGAQTAMTEAQRLGRDPKAAAERFLRTKYAQALARKSNTWYGGGGAQGSAADPELDAVMRKYGGR